MYRRILLATDGSSVSNQALAQAVMLAAAFQSELRVVCVTDQYSIDQSWWVNAEAFEELVQRMRAASNKILSEAAAEAQKSGVRAETRLLELQERGQRISDRIANEADAWPADLVVLGTHGRRGMDRLVLGSVAEGVARRASAPVMLVRSAAD